MSSAGQVPEIKIQVAGYLQDGGHLTRISFNATNFSSFDLLAAQVAVVIDTQRFGTPASIAASTFAWVANSDPCYSSAFRVEVRPSGLPGTPDNLYLTFATDWQAGTTVQGAFEYRNSQGLPRCMYYPLNAWISQLIPGTPQCQRVLATHRDWAQLPDDGEQGTNCRDQCSTRHRQIPNGIQSRRLTYSSGGGGLRN